MNTSETMQCDICQLSSGFTSADRRAIIVMVVLVSLALVLCYTGVLWYTIRTRYIKKKEVNTIVQSNEAFNQQEEFEEYVRPIDNENNRQTTTDSFHRVHFATEDHLIPV